MIFFFIDTPFVLVENIFLGKITFLSMFGCDSENDPEHLLPIGLQ